MVIIRLMPRGSGYSPHSGLHRDALPQKGALFILLLVFGISLRYKGGNCSFIIMYMWKGSYFDQISI